MGEYEGTREELIDRAIEELKDYSEPDVQLGKSPFSKIPRKEIEAILDLITHKPRREEFTVDKVEKPTRYKKAGKELRAYKQRLMDYINRCGKGFSTLSPSIYSYTLLECIANYLEANGDKSR